MRDLTFLLLIFSFAATRVVAQAQPTPSNASDEHEQLASQLEEIAMCHHAIKAAGHEAARLNQNRVYRYLIDADGHIYPIPERCKNIATEWVVAYTGMDTKDKANLDRTTTNQIGLTIPDMAADVGFLSTVIRYKDAGNWNKLDAPDAIK